MNRRPENQENRSVIPEFDWKKASDLFDFSWSTMDSLDSDTKKNNSPNIQKEEEGLAVIKPELRKLSNMRDAQGKMTPESIDHAFFAYSSQEMGKISDGNPEKKALESARRDLLIEMQGIKDPREKLKAISALTKEVVSLTGTVSGASDKGNKDMRQMNDSQNQQGDLYDRMKTFKDMLQKSEEQRKLKTQIQLGTARGNWDKSMWILNPIQNKSSSNALEEGLRVTFP